MLVCDFCACHTTQAGEGWAAYHRDNPEEIGEPRVAVFCPPCAAARHALLPEVAAESVCIWKPTPTAAGA